MANICDLFIVKPLRIINNVFSTRFRQVYAVKTRYSIKRCNPGQVGVDGVKYSTFDNGNSVADGMHGEPSL